MATFVKFNTFIEALAEKVHNMGSDTFKVFLTNTAPTAATDDELADITEISYTNCSARTITVSSSAQSSGTYTWVLTDLVLTASGGTVGPFRYVGIYNDTSITDRLVGYYDYGSSITLNDTETLTIDFSAATVTLTPV